jgi:hypothetical protein
VSNVVPRETKVRQNGAVPPIPAEVYKADLSDGPWQLISDAFASLADPTNRIVRVDRQPVQSRLTKPLC